MSQLNQWVDPKAARSRATKPAARKTTATAIFERLLGSIVSLQLVPGAALQEKLLAEEFGVSRTPVREALIRLAEIGLVDIFPQSGTFVCRIPVSSIPEALIVRKALEGVTVELAARLSTKPGIDRLDANLARQTAFAGLRDTSAFHDTDEAFHEAIALMSGHPGIWRVVRAAKVQIDRARQLTLPVPGRMDQVVAEHRTIRDAIARRDPKGARAAMMDHLDAVITDVRTLAANNPDYFSK
jgi:GntR family transcriptional regulator, rspAB operon transcriptional repressor